jgi:hypothetical protein
MTRDKWERENWNHNICGGYELSSLPFSASNSASLKTP